MTKDTRKMSDDEYQFPEEEYVTAEQLRSKETSADDLHGEHSNAETVAGQGAATAAAQSSLSSHFVAIAEAIKAIPILQNKRVLAAVGVAILALIVFKVISPSEKSHVKQVKANPQLVQEAQNNARLQGQLSSMQQGSQKNQKDINQLQQNVQGLTTELHQSTTNQARMSQAILALSDQVKQLSAELKAEQPKKKVKKGPLPPKLVYHLKAVIPGRAWIVNNFGQSTSVSVGDAVKQYGHVEAIEPQKGEIITSSGKLIRYGVDDS